MKEDDKDGNSQRARKWCMVMQGMYKKETIERFVHDKWDKISYLKIAQEIGDGGKRHLQGYFEITNKMSLKGVCALWYEPQRGFVPSHFEIAWHPVEAQHYIGNLEFVHASGEKKSGEVEWVYEYGHFAPDKGEARRQGKSWNDSLLEMKKMIDEGKSIYSLYQTHFIQMVYCGKAIAGYKDLIESRKRFPELCEGDTAEEEREIVGAAVAKRTPHFDVSPGSGSYKK